MLTGKSKRAISAREEHREALHKARDEFLQLFYSPRSDSYNVGTKELMCVLITQNMEILDLLRNGHNGKSENLNLKTGNLPVVSKESDG